MPGDMLVDHRAVLHFRTRLEVSPNGRHRLFVETLGGAIAGIIEGNSLDEVERKLARDGYQRIPPQMADDMDLMRLE